MVELKKTGGTKVFVHCGTLLKSVGAVGFSEKNCVFGKCLFFGLVLRISIVNEMIFIKN